MSVTDARVVVILGVFELGGAERQALLWADALRQAGAHVVVWALRDVVGAPATSDAFSDAFSNAFSNATAPALYAAGYAPRILGWNNESPGAEAASLLKARLQIMRTSLLRDLSIGRLALRLLVPIESASSEALAADAQVWKINRHSH